jgi:AraC family transcriptional regulator of adaptative response / DNA-3-methyladenine glycosylase II
MKISYDPKEFYRAHLAKDYRFDGKFFVAVKTTGIYCRPVCPARKAKLENLTFYLQAAEAEEAGYRPCLRCRPETAPGSSAWIGTSATVRRAISLMDAFAADGMTITRLADRLGVGVRWLRELFQQQLGASPKSILLTKKLDIARNLLDNSSLSITEIAFSSGFQSVRRFNDAFKQRFCKTPNELRGLSAVKAISCLQLSYRPPYAWKNLLAFLKTRAIAGVELVKDNSYQRLISLEACCGWIKVSLADNNKINVEFNFNGPANLVAFVARLKNMFDLEADPMAIAAVLKEDQKLKPYLEEFNGLRIPGAWDGFELAVRAIVGQRISVKAAQTILARIVKQCAVKQDVDSSLAIDFLFPTPQQLLEADISAVGLPAARIASIRALAKELVEEKLFLDGTEDYNETCEKLLAIKGVGKWTVDYIALRLLKNPDIIPETDLVIKKKIEALQLVTKKWAPWRAYAAILLWNIDLKKSGG